MSDESEAIEKLLGRRPLDMDRKVHDFGLLANERAAIEKLIAFVNIPIGRGKEADDAERIKILESVKGQASALASLLNGDRPGQTLPLEITDPLQDLRGTMSFVASGRTSDRWIAMLRQTHFIVPPPGQIVEGDSYDVALAIALSNAYVDIYRNWRALGMTAFQRDQELNRIFQLLKTNLQKMGANSSVDVARLASREFRGPAKQYADAYMETVGNKDILPTSRAEFAWSTAAEAYSDAGRRGWRDGRRRTNTILGLDVEHLFRRGQVDYVAARDDSAKQQAQQRASQVRLAIEELTKRPTRTIGLQGPDIRAQRALGVLREYSPRATPQDLETFRRNNPSLRGRDNDLVYEYGKHLNTFVTEQKTEETSRKRLGEPARANAARGAVGFIKDSAADPPPKLSDKARRWVDSGDSLEELLKKR